MFGGSNASDYKIVMAKHHAGSSAVLSSGPAVQLRPHNFVVTCIASQKKFALSSVNNNFQEDQLNIQKLTYHSGMFHNVGYCSKKLHVALVVC